MPLTTSLNMLARAREGRYAVGAFNAENMEMVQAIISAAERLEAPVMIQTTPGTLRYASPEMFFAMTSVEAKGARVPVAIHLDHGEDLAMAARALRAGYTSIMIDGSKKALGENIAITREVVMMCEPCGVPVEGELGRVGGKEDDLEGGEGYTDPGEAVEFVERTGVRSLAVGVGTAHGVYAVEPALNVELISALRGRIDIPMVLHGASGLRDDVVRDCVARGICKVNFATELRVAFTKAASTYMSESPKALDPKKFGAAARDAVADLVAEKIRLCGCEGRG